MAGQKKEGYQSEATIIQREMQKCRCFPDHTCEEANWWGVEAEGEAVGSLLRPALVVSRLFSSRWVAFYIECKIGWAQKKGHPASLISSVKSHPSTCQACFPILYGITAWELPLQDK